jgi:Domain of unknown function (DUF1707)
MPDPQLRAADADREAVATILGRHMADGRLTLAEYDERVALAWAARTYGDLAALTADLPASRTTVPAPVPQTGACGSSPVALWASHGRTAEHSWQAWLTTSVTVLAVYLAIALASWELHYFWPVWVIGPWGAVLLAQTLADRTRGVDRSRAG